MFPAVTSGRLRPPFFLAFPCSMVWPCRVLDGSLQVGSGWALGAREPKVRSLRVNEGRAEGCPSLVRPDPWFRVSSAIVDLREAGNGFRGALECSSMVDAMPARTWRADRRTTSSALGHEAWWAPPRPAPVSFRGDQAHHGDIHDRQESCIRSRRD